MTFYTYTLGNYWQIKNKKLKSGHYTFRKCYIQGASRKKQYHYFYHEAPKISKKKKRFLQMHFGLIVANQN